MVSCSFIASLLLIAVCQGLPQSLVPPTAPPPAPLCNNKPCNVLTGSVKVVSGTTSTTTTALSVYWSLGAIYSFSNFNPIVADAFGATNRAFIKDPVGANSVLQVKCVSQTLHSLFAYIEIGTQL